MRETDKMRKGLDGVGEGERLRGGGELRWQG